MESAARAIEPEHWTLDIFFLTDQVEKKNVSIEHCPTKQMIGDFMSKPLQGELFSKFKAAVMGHNNSLFEGPADLQG